MRVCAAVAEVKLLLSFVYFALKSVGAEAQFGYRMQMSCICFGLLLQLAGCQVSRCVESEDTVR